ncbi:FAD-dependent monooxygenase [Nocardia pseudovaccinii]|uniref:FAD-dependent monooxygenase n=1 Tax=Nocardia pseudovaccinii TaxID=189540 RepID=UPI0007A3F788|nr:FAD-dependent monooxygenase [Nocardia pseudovaccinii]
MSGLPATTQVLVAGGGPVGLATAVELGRRGISCVVIEPREIVSHARPRCKTVNIRTMEHLRRWGLADQLRKRAPLPVEWSQDIVFCTTLAGRELSRFTGVLGLLDGGDRYPEWGQQAPQFVLEELLRETVAALDSCVLVTGWSVAGLDQRRDGVDVSIVDATGTRAVIAADYVVGADGARSVVREAIGSSYVGEQALRPNFGMVFRAPDLWDHVAHGPAVQYWTVNADTPGIVGPLDRDGTWWCVAFGVDRENGERTGRELIRGLIGMDTDVQILSTDPWTARMQLVDRVADGRVFLAGDAAHLNPPFGGHGLNTGIGDAVDLGWKLAAVLGGWGGPALLDSYAAERRPVQDRVIAEATANMKVLSTDLITAALDADGESGDLARAAVDIRIQETKHAEFHALDLVLNTGYDDSPIVVPATGGCSGLPGYRLPHVWLEDDISIYDELGTDLSLLLIDETTVVATRAAAEFRSAAERLGIPLTVVGLRRADLRDRYGCGLLLVRPDQYVAWAADVVPADPEAILDHVRGHAERRRRLLK